MELPRPRTRAFYAQLVSTLAEEGHGPTAILKKLEAAAKAGGHTDWPSSATVRRLLKAHREMPESVRREQAVLRWPRTFDLELLPWEWARQALDLARIDAFSDDSPTVRKTKWFCRLRLASPTMPIGECDEIAERLAASEYATVLGLPVEISVDGLHERLVYEPWRDKESLESFNEVAKRKGFDEYPVLTTRTEGDLRTNAFDVQVMEHRGSRNPDDVAFLKSEDLAEQRAWIESDLSKPEPGVELWRTVPTYPDD